jgi:hypothetical protein
MLCMERASHTSAQDQNVRLSGLILAKLAFSETQGYKLECEYVTEFT